jgi:hypothetical protein
VISSFDQYGYNSRASYGISIKHILLGSRIVRFSKLPKPEHRAFEPLNMALKILLPLLSLYATIISCAPTSELPVIDLGYVQQRATVYNSTNDYYVFKNIRFAAPPLGDLRFRKPTPPVYEGKIQDGNITGTECVQTLPGMPGEGSGIFGGESYIIGTEDCLYLDVYVPASLKATDKAPVLQWFYGGGYMFGSKEMWGDPAGLIQAADEPMIYVASNYR